MVSLVTMGGTCWDRSFTNASERIWKRLSWPRVMSSVLPVSCGACDGAHRDRSAEVSPARIEARTSLVCCVGKLDDDRPRLPRPLAGRALPPRSSGR